MYLKVWIDSNHFFLGYISFNKSKILGNQKENVIIYIFDWYDLYIEPRLHEGVNVHGIAIEVRI